MGWVSLSKSPVSRRIPYFHMDRHHKNKLPWTGVVSAGRKSLKLVVFHLLLILRVGLICVSGITTETLVTVVNEDVSSVKLQNN